MPLPVLAARALPALVTAGLPAARQAARRLLSAGGRLVAGGAALGTGGVLAERAFGRRAAPQRMPRFAYAPKRRRAKGITAAELRGARKVARLVAMYGLKPKYGHSAGRRPRRKIC